MSQALLRSTDWLRQSSWAVTLSAALAVLSRWAQPSAGLFEDGLATYYRRGLMEKVAHNRGLDLDGTLGGVALNRCGDLERRVWLQWMPVGPVEGPYLVVDCAAAPHFADRERLRRVVEVSAEVAERREFYRYGPVPVRVWFVEPPILIILPADRREPQ
jgi:hypothetical protein